MSFPWYLHVFSKEWDVQLTLVISNSLISNYRLSRSENLVPVLIQRSTNRQQNIVEKRRNCSLWSNFSSFPQYFQYISNLESNYIFILLKVVIRLIVFLSSANLICRSTDISKYFIESLGVRDNESRLYIISGSYDYNVLFGRLMVCILFTCLGRAVFLEYVLSVCVCRVVCVYDDK